MGQAWIQMIDLKSFKASYNIGKGEIFVGTKP
jgi:hypothetical protein